MRDPPVVGRVHGDQRAVHDTEPHVTADGRAQLALEGRQVPAVLKIRHASSMHATTDSNDPAAVGPAHHRPYRVSPDGRRFARVSVNGYAPLRG
ncbi:hypothetical protein GCM10010383_61740 [Streptomyces lomondensis]|uniref:Uncharacterized protein n=1 Tax=Streptomyces lomondensis TaxID=68229 RepID=A0ABQ2XL80_9ACTN|nr:hypothetical protein GCM10010383_61740 [Streptomyces lomondensis]